MSATPPGTRIFRTVVRHDDPIVRDHRVHERRVMPGVTFLDLFLRATRELAAPDGGFELRHIVFPEAIAVPENGARDVEITLTPADAHWDLAARSRPAGPAGEWTLNARATGSRPEAACPPAMDLASWRTGAARIADAGELYAQLRQHGIRHFAFMQPLGRVYVSPAGALAEVRLGDEAARYRDHLLLHPVFLDFATGVSFFSGYADARYASGTYIPLSIERFTAWGPLGGNCWIRVPARATAEAAGADLGIDPEITLHADDGRLLARFSQLTFKRVRIAGALGRAATDGMRPSAAPAPRIAAPTTTTLPAASPAAHAEHHLTALIAATLRIEPGAVNPASGFYDLGLDSGDLLALAGKLEAHVGQTLYPTLLFEYPNIRQLAGYLAGKFPDRFTAAPVETGAAPAARAAAELQLFDFAWTDAPAEESPAPLAGTRWLLLAPDDRFARGFAAAAPAGVRLTTALPGERFQRTGPGAFNVRPATVADFQQVLAEITAAGGRLEGVIHGWNFSGEAHSPAATPSALDLGLNTLAALAQALLQNGPAEPLRFLSVQADAPTFSPGAWAIAGFYASLAREAPRWEGRLASVPADPGLAAMHTWREAACGASASVVRLAPEGRQAWRARGPIPASSGAPALRRGGHYLITGGAGGIGHALAAYLLQQYAAHVVLLGRTPPAAGTLRPLEAAASASGGSVCFTAADAGDESGLAAAFAAARNRRGAFHGIFHAAGVLDDSLALNFDPARAARVLHPKVRGTLLLDELTAGDPLDFLVLFSSLSGVAGNRGQTIYAAANRFLDGFALGRDERVRAGERSGRTLAIDWPLWADGGMRTSARQAERLEQETGMTPLDAATAWRALEAILARPAGSYAVTYGDAARMRSLLGALSPDAPVSAPALAPGDRGIRDDDIAIIGVSGRYPQARDVGEFHANLAAGRDCITTIPEARWDHRRHFDPDRSKAGKCYSQWGGFIDDVDRFDPVFFNLAPRDAELMDPQERLFLETAWSAFEDAGYPRSALARPGTDGRVGVFVGVMWGGYQLFGAEELQKGRVVTANSPYWSIANRISYFFDLNGPSLAVDSACSSSLTALHYACESIRRGECRLALAGGVNLSLHPTKYLLLAQMGMLSSHGRCKTFAADADGYTPGEGIGALVLKRLRDALADGDPIHAVVKGSALNHDGRANGFTVPNPQAQARVITAALERAGVSPRDISYIEAHGTGTSLGDPVEIAGLTRAFRTATNDTGFCAIGSVKSVIGHLEAAAGVSAVTKVLLQFRHGQLFPSIHAGTLNPSIDFAATPFRVQRELAPWPRPASADGRGELPRVAGVSSFGAGGANVHVVLAEPPDSAPTPFGHVPPVVVLSAQNRDRLRAVAERLRAFLGTPAADWTSIRHTLQAGREPLDERLAFVAASPAEAIATLTAYLDESTSGRWVTGTFSRRTPPPDATAVDALVREWQRGTLAADAGPAWEPLARYWAAGGNVDWHAWVRGTVRRISLPTYPFSGRRLWLARGEETPSVPVAAVPASSPSPPVASPAIAAAPNAPVALLKPVWRETTLPVTRDPGGTVVLVGGDVSLAQALGRRLTGACIPVAGSALTSCTAGSYAVGSSAPHDLPRVLAAIERDAGHIGAVVLLAEQAAWSATALEHAAPAGTPALLQSLYSLGRDHLSAIRRDLRILVVAPGSARHDPLVAAAAGFLRALRLEQPRARPGVVTTDATTVEHLAAAIERGLAADVFEVRLRGDRAWRRTWEACDPRADAATATDPFAAIRNGAIVITGGAGGIGLHLARHIALARRLPVVLLGRSPLPDWKGLDAAGLAALPAGVRGRVEALAAIGHAGGAISYLAADITHEAELGAALAATRQRAGGIAAVLHCAGTTADATLLRKDPAAFAAVLAPKLRGTLLLDQLTRQDPLACFVLFSSTTALTGNLGQCDYAAANAFLDGFAAVREHWRARGLRAGRTQSVNWPLWADGGMQADADVARALARRGVVPLDADAGIRALEQSLALLLPQVAVWSGDVGALDAALSDADATAPVAAEAPVTPESGHAPPAALDYLAKTFGAVLKLDPAEIDPSREFADYGVDSIAMKELVTKLNRDLGDVLDPFVMAEQNTLQRLAGHLGTLGAQVPGAPLRRPAPAAAAPDTLPPPAPPVPASAAASAMAPARSRDADTGDIAVIGLAGVFPGAPDVATLWGNLLAARCSVGEVPAERWAVAQHFSPEAGVTGRSYSKWGGFVDGLFDFDPDFFGYSEAVGAVLDPLHRLFLETSVRAFEDAGCRPEDLRGRVAGVFVGARQGAYADLVGMERLLAADPGDAWRRNSACMIPQHVAAFHHLRGPCYVIDTACSSSLVAVHTACESLRRGECELAIAGGVEALVGPAAFIHFSQSRSLSPRGACRPFESGADGTVLGEGAAAVVLKPLAAALRDGDHIHAVVRGSAVNNFGGATEARSQVGTMKEAMRRALHAAGTSLADLGYLELHGEGSLLRDALELRSIREIWEEDAVGAAGRCPVGSIKANIGHLLLASGIAGFIKACLILRHGQIPPHLADARLARFAGLDDTPFHFATEPRVWTPAAGVRRTVGVNATGIAGTNCFLVCSESPRPTTPRALPPRPMRKRRLTLLPAPATPESPAPTAPFTAAPDAQPSAEPASAMSDATDSSGQELLRIEQDLSAICRRILRAPAVDPRTTFFELGMDSFKILQLFHEVARAFQHEIDPTRLAEFASIERLARHLHEAPRARSAAAPAKPAAPGGNGHGAHAAGHAASACAFRAAAAPFVSAPAPAPAATELDFGLYFFANYDHGIDRGKYRLLLDAVKFADEHGFSSVFTPERHFEDFGGLYPNPAIVGAALAATTRQIQIRAGSVVSPLHDALRIAEEWAMVDNLSDGRAGVAFTYGWQCDDFVLAPDSYRNRHSVMFRQIDDVRRLWRGQAVERVNGLGRTVQIRTYPRPVQKEIPVWVTCAINRDSFVNAGRIGANIVTFLLGQSLADLREKIAAYRAALAESGFDPALGRVSLMVHTFVGDDLPGVKRQVREPFLTFIRAQAQLARNLVQSVDPSSDITDPKIMNALMDIGFERFFGDSGLMGTVASCREAAVRFKALGVDELSCLIDFGLDHDSIMGSLRRLADVKAHFAGNPRARGVFPDISARGGTKPVSFTVPAPAPVSGLDPAERNGDALSVKLDTFRSYLPGGSRVPGSPALPVEPAPPRAASLSGSRTPFTPAANGNGSHAATAAGTTARNGAPDARHEPFPLTAVQKAYWMGRNPQLELGGTSTHGYAELRVTLDLPRFQRAIQRVIDRHPMLRAVVESGRQQRVLPGAQRYELPVVDLTGLAAAEQERRLRQEREGQSHRIFDPARWPLFDFRVFVLAPGRQYLLFGFDSLIADASSITIFFREIMALYHAPETALPELAYTFREYVQGYEAFRTSADYARDRAFWLERIPALPPAPELPLRKAPEDVRQPRFDRLAATVPHALWADARNAAKRELVTPTVLLFTAFAQVLAEASRRPDFSLNLTVFNRLPLHPDVNRIIGDFTSLMIVAAQYRPGKTFWENAAALQGTVLQALAHRTFDGVEVIKELARQRGLLGRAVIPVVFTSNLLNTENGDDGLSTMGEVAYMITQTTQAYLDNQVAENRDGLYIAWDYVTELFEPAVVEGMFRRYVGIVEALGRGNTLPAAPAPLAGNPAAGGLDAFVARYNATHDATIAPTTLAALFAAQVARTPDAPALRLGDEELTYRELDLRSNQVAHYLRQRGMGRGDLVGVVTPRTLSTIIHTLGIAKSGAAYVPIDPEYPEARQRYILEKAGAAVVLDTALHEQIRRESPSSPFPCPSQPGDLAYIIFTSGSTGQPKGVMITHAAVTNTLIDLNRRFQVGPGDRVLGLSSMCFDLSVYDVFGTLSAGACLVLIDDIRNPEHLARTARQQRITIWNSVPTLFRMLVEASPGNDPLPDLRLAMMSGDWIPINVPTDALRRFPRTRLFSLGGATEASIWSIYYPITTVEPQWTSIPYGVPLANQTFYVLDDNLEFCPVGTPGQLYIGGVGLSSGYFKDAEKTAAAYPAHPRLGRLYRTGDWGVWREAGHIEFLGRRDQQVKIRGFRVELGEIEARLLKHPGIKQAVVLDKTDAKGNRSLCAYIVPKTSSPTLR